MEGYSENLTHVEWFRRENTGFFLESRGSLVARERYIAAISGGFNVVIAMSEGDHQALLFIVAQVADVFIFI